MATCGKKSQMWVLAEWEDTTDGKYSVVDLECVAERETVVIDGCLVGDHHTRWVPVEWREGRKPQKGQSWPLFNAKILEIGGRHKFVIKATHVVTDAEPYKQSLDLVTDESVLSFCRKPRTSNNLYRKQIK